MIAQAQAGWPEEICGLLAADGTGRVVEWLPVPNVAADKQITYRMAPMHQLLAFERMDEEGWTLAAIYHSHPQSAAYPSPKDRHDAFDPYDGVPLYPGTPYLILSLADRDAPAIRAFLLPTRDEVVEMRVEIV